jgi:hypothetical protein
MKVSSSKWLVLIFTCISYTCFSQEIAGDFNKFLQMFPKVKLPTCIDYRDEFEKEDGQQGEPSPKSDSLVISNELVRQFLLAPNEHLYYSDEFGDTSECAYYYICQLNIDQPFHILVFERQYNLTSWRYSEKYLCTISNKGILISKKLVASYNQIDFYISDEGRQPFYGERKGCIKKDLQVDVIYVTDNSKSQDGTQISYFINAVGQINPIAK